MKKIILFAAVILSIFSANAQTKKSKKYKKAPNKEAVAVAKFKKAVAQKKLLRDSTIIGLKYNDSLRLAGDSIADLQKDSMSMAYREQGLKNIDSANKVMYTNIITDRQSADKFDENQAAIIASLKLSDYQKMQLKYINQTYSQKANAILNNTNEAAKAQQLEALNVERRAKIKTILGKRKERLLDKERKAYVQKNGSDATTLWISDADNATTKQ